MAGLLSQLLLLASVGSSALAQDPGAAGVPQAEPAPQGAPEGAVARPPLQIQGAEAQPPAVVRNIPSIKEYRQGVTTVPYVRRLEDVRQLDLSQVDFSAPVLARLNGQDVTQSDFKAWLALTGGQTGVLNAQLEVMSRRLLKKLVESGASADAYAVSEADIEAKLKGEEELARSQGEEGLRQYKERIEQQMGMDKYRAFVTAHLQAEKILLPPIVPLTEGGEPQSLPVESAALLDDQPELRDYLNNAYLGGQDFPAMFRTQFLRMLLDKLIERAVIQYATESPLPENVYMTIEGEPVMVDDVLRFVTPDRETRENALRALLLYRSIDQVLKDNDALLSNEDFAAEFAAHDAEYRGTLFPLRNLIGLRGFLNLAEYREYYRRRVAFQRMIADTVTEKELREHHEKYGKLFYDSGKASVETIWASLVEAEKTAKQGQAGWSLVQERIDNAKRMLEEGKAMGEVRTALGQAHPLEPTGVIAAKMRNELRQLFGETEYTIFIGGYSLADDIFYNRVEGELVGPVRFDRTMLPGTRQMMGMLLAKVGEFSKTGAAKSFDQQKQLLTSDYYDLRYTYFAHECLKNATIELVASK